MLEESIIVTHYTLVAVDEEPTGDSGLYLFYFLVGGTENQSEVLVV